MGLVLQFIPGEIIPQPLTSRSPAQNAPLAPSEESPAGREVSHPLRRRWRAGDCAVADVKPEFVLHALRMEGAGVVDPFVPVLDGNALGIERWLGFAGGFGGGAVDGALRAFGIFLFGESKRQSENQQCGEQEQAEGVLLHAAYPDAAMIIRIAADKKGGRVSTFFTITASSPGLRPA